MSDIKFNCPYCRQFLEAPADMLGQLIECPSCKKTFEVAITQARVVPPPPISQPTRPCPFCGESLLMTAQKCKYCGEFLHPALRGDNLSISHGKLQVLSTRSRGTYILFGLLFGGLGIHNFYAGRYGYGAAQAAISLTLGWLYGIGIIIVGIWVIAELCTITEDGDGKKMQ